MECLTIEAYCHSPGSIVSDTLCKQTFVWIPMIECPDHCRDPTVDKHTLRSYTRNTHAHLCLALVRRLRARARYICGRMQVRRVWHVLLLP